MHDLCSLFHTNDLCCGNYTWKLIGFLKWTITGLFFLYFRLFYIVDTNQIKVCRCLDLNRGSLVLEATALPTKPQPLLIVNLLFTRVTLWSVLWHSNMFYLWSVQCCLYAFLLLSNYFCVIIFTCNERLGVFHYLRTWVIRSCEASRWTWCRTTSRRRREQRRFAEETSHRSSCRSYASSQICCKVDRSRCSQSRSKLEQNYIVLTMGHSRSLYLYFGLLRKTKWSLKNFVCWIWTPVLWWRSNHSANCASSTAPKSIFIKIFVRTFF